MGYGCAAAPAFGYLDYDPYFEDLLARIYTMVKRRNGIVKIHQGQCVSPKTRSRVYDYLWVGECVKHASDLLETAQFDPYVIVNPDYRFLEEKNTDALYAMTVPTLQFLLRVDGRPVTGERAFVPGVEYVNNPGNNETLHFEAMQRWHREHPNGPHAYSEWSDIPDNAEDRDRWFDCLALYAPMVSEDTVAYVDLTEQSLTVSPASRNLRLSLFVNDEIYLCVSNVGHARESIVLRDAWIDRVSGQTVKSLHLSYGELRFLKLART
jgi:hypothetical protein